MTLKERVADKFMQVAVSETQDGLIEFPIEQYTVKTIQILAKRRSGKSYLAGLIAEKLLAADVPIVIVDPIAAYWGLKEKFDLIIFGPKDYARTDIPILGETPKELQVQATLCAEFVALNKRSVILDLVLMTETHQQVFAGTFFKILYKLNAHRRHVFVEEADIFAPQSPPPGFEDALSCRHQLDNLVRRGGSKGLGTTVITQRPALVSKNILSQCDLSIMLNVQAPQDLKAIMDIMRDDERPKQETNQIRGRIKTLAVGHALFYSPEWLKQIVFGKVMKRQTYHAGATLGDPDYRGDGYQTQIIQPARDIEETYNMMVRAVSIKPDEPISRVGRPEGKVNMRTGQWLYDAKKKIAELEEDKKGLLRIITAKDILITQKEDGIKKLQNVALENLAYRDAILPLIEFVKKKIGRSDDTDDNKTTLRVSPTTKADLKVQNPSEISVNFHEESIEGKLLYLIKCNDWKANLSLSALHSIIAKTWDIGSSHKPQGTNAARYRRQLQKALENLQVRPNQFITSYVQAGTEFFAPVENAQERIKVNS